MHLKLRQKFPHTTYDGSGRNRRQDSVKKTGWPCKTHAHTREIAPASVALHDHTLTCGKAEEKQQSMTRAVLIAESATCLWRTHTHTIKIQFGEAVGYILLAQRRLVGKFFGEVQQTPHSLQKRHDFRAPECPLRIHQLGCPLRHSADEHFIGRQCQAACVNCATRKVHFERQSFRRSRHA